LHRFSVVKWDDTMCAFCESLERHRMVWSFFTRQTDLLDGSKKRMLHIVPELHFQAMLSRALGDGYVTADLLRSTFACGWTSRKSLARLIPST